MARDKNGWIKLHSAILDKDFSLVEYKIFTGLLLLANSLKHNSLGLVDLSLRDTASRLRVSIGALQEAREKFARDGRIEIIPIKREKAKPIMAIKIINFEYYQGTQKVSPSEHSVSPREHSQAKNGSTKKTKKPENKDDDSNFDHFIEKLKPEYPDIDVDLEVRKFNDYNEDTKRKIKSPRLALRNWLDKAREIKLRGNGDGKTSRSVRPVPKHHEYKQPHEY